MPTHLNATQGAPAVIADRIALVYDRTGRILHVHRVTTLEGGTPRGDEELRRAALEHAARGRYDVSSADTEVLIVEARELKPGHIHHVDVAARQLRAERRER